jgi:predicted ABC-class ATPase
VIVKAKEIQIAAFQLNSSQKWLPTSGSKSQAGTIIEAMEIGANVLLMDEDTSAANFIMRDHRM